MWMRGGTSKGAVFLAEDLPGEPAARDAFLVGRVQIDRRGLQHPVLVAHRAGGVTDLFQRYPAVGMHRQFAGESAAVPVQYLKIRRVEIGAPHRVINAGLALDAELRILEIHPAFD